MVEKSLFDMLYVSQGADRLTNCVTFKSGWSGNSATIFTGGFRLTGAKCRYEWLFVITYGGTMWGSRLLVIGSDTVSFGGL
jgi:hypothetical protein